MASELAFPKPETVKDTAYKRWIESQPCIVSRLFGDKSYCGGDVVGHHENPPGTGKGLRDDRYLLPMCVRHHTAGPRGIARHQTGKKTFWGVIDPQEICAGLRATYKARHP